MVVLAWSAASMQAQEVVEPPFGPHEPSAKAECGKYQWPEVQAPCPEVQIKQKHDHSPLKQYQARGWDTVVTCQQRELELSCMPFLPVQYFNGQYTVDTIPFDPPDPTFARGKKMPVSTDDDFSSSPTQIPFSFFFFGERKEAFVLGANGLITFDTTAAGKYCPWKYSSPLPWPDNTKGAPASMGTTIANMRDAIYGIYEDTHPISSYLDGDQGIYYGIQDEAPCRKIICSWNGIPPFPGVRNKDNRCTYQIVCYEGSNIVEVHVKRRGRNTDWQDGHGIIGVQNATGLPQEKGSIGTSTAYVQTGALPAYYPEGANLLTDTLENIAFRFTPQGNTVANGHWYRIFDDGRDSVELPFASVSTEDTNGYQVPMGEVMSSCPTLTTAVVSPTCVSRYVYHIRFKDASNYWYNLYDTITIGIDTTYDLSLHRMRGDNAARQVDICRGNIAQLVLEFPELQDTSHLTFHLTRTQQGTDVPLANSQLTIGQMYTDVQTRTKKIPMVLQPDKVAQTLPGNEPDTVHLAVEIDFINGCSNVENFLIITHPSYDTVDEHGICEGESFTWEYDSLTYTSTTHTPQVTVSTTAGCDSVVHLNLTVYEKSFSVDERRDCKPLTWLNGKTYTGDNSATREEDTVVLHNYWGCDSVVQLDFQIQPMEAIIESSLTHFDYDHMEVELTDVSYGGYNRKWLFPTGDPSYDQTARYTISDGLDSARIAMVEFSTFGCIDTAYITLPFQRDVIWVPNIFTPSAQDNNLFGARSRHLIKAEMRIYNRFGVLMHICGEVDCQWDGTDRNGRLCPEGTYVYVIRYITEYAPLKTETLKGSVTLIY